MLKGNMLNSSLIYINFEIKYNFDFI